MRLARLGAIAAIGAMLAMPVSAQTTTTTPATRPPATAIPPAQMPSAMPPATRPMPSATAPSTTVPSTTPSTATAPAPMPGKATAKATTGPVNINTASASELDKVKYIGPRRAAKIIAGRPWTNADDIVAKKIMPKSLFDKIKSSLTTS